MITRALSKRTLIKLAGLAALVVSLAVGAAPAHAVIQPVVWDLGCATQPACQNTSYASPHTFTSLGPPPTYDLTTYGFNADNTSHALFSKFSTPDETGLGLLQGPNNEILGGQYIDLVKPPASKPPGTLTDIYHLLVSSVQTGESFNVYRSNGAPGAGTLVGLLFSAQTHSSANCSAVTDICDYTIDMTGFSTLAIQGIAGDVLINAFTTTQDVRITPEPMTLILLGLGLFGAGFARRRKL